MKQKSKPPVRVAITGAAGQIGYQLAFRIASGQLFGQDQPIILQLLEITPALGALNGVAMELAGKAGAHVTDVRRAIIWGNHSATQFPDLAHATVNGTPALAHVSQAWYRDEFIPTVQQRGAAIIKARGASSAASAASAAIDHVRTWLLGSAPGDFVSMGVPADGSYGIAEGVIYSYPVTTAAGRYTIVQGLAINDFSRARMAATERELREERDGVKDLL